MTAAPETFFEPNFVLPPLPEVATRVRELIETGDANASEVAELLQSDVALTAQILAIVNSAYYALPREVNEVRHAVGPAIVAFLGKDERLGGMCLVTGPSKSICLSMIFPGETNPGLS